MKINAIFLASSLSIYATLAGADCRPLEYAEIKDTPSNELVKTYCYYGEIADIHRDTQKNMHEVVLEKLKGETRMPVINQIEGILKRTDAEQGAKISECRQQQAKIETALKARRAKLSCANSPASDGGTKK